MTIEQRLNHLADNYRGRGYSVVVHPEANDLPDFAKDFKVEILATKNGNGILTSAKKNHSDLAADPELPRYAELISNQPGWQFEIVVLGPELQPITDDIEAKELTDEDIQRIIADIARMIQAGFVQQAFVAAWSVLEQAMRRRLQAEGEQAGWGSSARTLLNELYTTGILSTSDFRGLEGLMHARNALVHGFASPGIDQASVSLLIQTADRLLDESRAASKAG